MNYPMRRADRQLPPEEIVKILRENDYGILSTVCADGYPYGLPISYVYEDGILYFHHTAETSLLRQNISRSVKACFTVVGRTQTLPAKFSTKYESVIAFGTLRESDEKMAVLTRLVQKFSPDYLEQGTQYARSALERVSVYAFRIEQVTGKARR